ncbi:hypothetical protein DFH09DRAFT_1313492 [Mycena vulgaris]|nr:hypothetical protein DFH09DRAFT_1313492 [Mycena vulgaris]
MKGLKPGKKSWVHGTKLVFLSARFVAWHAAKEQGVVVVGKFYTEIANLYILKYGYDLGDNEDLEEDIADPQDANARIPGSDKLNKEEADRHSKLTANLRKRITAWYRRTYRGVDKQDKNIFADLLSGALDMAVGCPTRSQPTHFFSRKFYEERIKGRFESAWALEVERTKNLGEEPPAEIKIRNEVTKEVWEEETEDFWAEVLAAVDTEHRAAVKAWEMTWVAGEEKSAEVLSASLKNAGFLLEPLAEAIMQKFGMNVSIMLCGPIGDRGGAIEVQSVHARHDTRAGAAEMVPV